MKLNVNTDTVLKRCETCGITYETCDYFLEYTNFKDDLIKYKYLCCCKNYQKYFDEKLEKRFLNTCKYSMITIRLFYFCKKVFILMSIWMIGKN